MGNDGSTIAKGKDLRVVYGEADMMASNEEYRLSVLDIVCALTSLPLSSQGKSERLVGDYKGQVFLKERLLEAVLEKSSEDKEKLAHIKTLKDIVDLEAEFDGNGALVCPINGSVQTESFKFCYLRTCGCVLSLKVLLDLRSHLKISEEQEDAAESNCPHCSHQFTFNFDLVILSTETQSLHEAFNERNYEYLTNVLKVTHSKKERKRKKPENSKQVKKLKRKCQKSQTSSKLA